MIKYSTANNPPNVLLHFDASHKKHYVSSIYTQVLSTQSNEL